jgi:hypothetical protein
MQGKILSLFALILVSYSAPINSPYLYCRHVFVQLDFCMKMMSAAVTNRLGGARRRRAAAYRHTTNTI